MDEQHDDPFDGLEDWAKDVERRATRADRLRRLRRLHSKVGRRRPRAKTGTSRTVLWLASAIVVAAVVLAAALPALQSWLPSGYAGDDSAMAYPTQSVPDGVSVTTSASASPTDPFEGTPAASYPTGEAGITLPPATAVTGFTAAQVGAALQQVHAALVAGRLDRKMLVGHDPEAFLVLLAPSERTRVGKWFTTTTYGSVATWIDPAVKLDPDEQPRVSGRVTFASRKVDGIQTLQVTTNFVWVYAFTGMDYQPLAAVHDEIRWEFPSTERLRAADKGMWVGDVRSYFAWMDCAASAKGLLAPGRGGGDPEPSRSEDPNAYLKADHTLEIRGTCTRRSQPPNPVPATSDLR